MNCELKFLRNNHGVFYSGSHLDASIQLQLTESMIVNGNLICLEMFDIHKGRFTVYPQIKYLKFREKFL